MAKKYVPNTLDEFIFESQYSIDEGIFDKAHLKKAGETLRKGAGWFEPSLLSVQQAIKAGLKKVQESPIWQDRLEQVEEKLPAQKEKFLEFLGRNPEVKYFKWDGKEFVDTGHKTPGGGGILIGANKNQPKYESFSGNPGGDESIYSFTWDTAVDVKKEGDKWVIDRDGEEESDVFDDVLKENGVHYEIVNPHGPGGWPEWPEITYSGTKEQLAPIMALLNASGFNEKEILDMLKDWNGDEDDLIEILG